MGVTAIVLTLNEERNISGCLDSLSWADQTVVFDSYSSDDTVALARKCGAEVRQNPFQDYAQQHNDAMDCVEAEWILFVDADERATPELAKEVRSVTSGDRKEVAWWVPRHNYIFGRLTLVAGWYPDYQSRLLLKGHARWERPVHEVAIVDGQEGYLRTALIHFNYDNLAEFRSRQEKYNEYDARILYERGVRPRVHTPYGQGVRHFWWRFGTLRGYRDGLHGARLSLLTAYYEMKKYQLLAQMWRAQER